MVPPVRTLLFIRESADSPRMFRSDFLDLFSRTHPAIVPMLFVPGAIVSFVLSLRVDQRSVFSASLLCVGGFVGWTLAEYWLHRLFFHWKAPGRWGERLHFLVHGVHHTWPR